MSAVSVSAVSAAVASVASPMLPPLVTGIVPDDTISPRPLVTKYRTESAPLVDTSTRISPPATTGLAWISTPAISGNAARSKPDQLPRSNGYVSSSKDISLMLRDSGEYESR